MAIKVSGTEVISDDKRILNNEDLPDIRPSLLLDFANSKTLDPRITFTRGSTATYWDGKTTAKAEENLITRSQDFSTIWSFGASASDGTITNNNATAPDGTTTAALIQATATTSQHYLQRPSSYYSPVSGQTYTLSCYLKAGTVDDVQFVFGNGADFGSAAYINVDLTAGTITHTASSISASSITDVGNGWYRVTMSAPAIGSNNQGNFITSFVDPAAPTGRLQNFTTAGTETYYIWGCQVEQRSSATAYTATTTSPIVKYQPVLQTAASGEARFDHDPVTGESKGLLIEEARTNLLTYSQDFNQWSSQGAVTRSTTTGPDGVSNSAFVITDDNASAYEGVGFFITVPNDTSERTISVFVKKTTGGTAPVFGINFSYEGGTAASITPRLNTDTGELPYNTTSDVRVEDSGNWWRLIATNANNGTGNTTLSIRLYPAAAAYGGTTDTATATGSAIIAFAQVEEGSFPTSYIPTSGSTVTRAADVAEITGSNFTDWYRQDGGTVFVDFDYTYNDNGTGFPSIFDIGNAVNFNDRTAILLFEGADTLRCVTNSSSVSQASLALKTGLTGSVSGKASFALAEDNFGGSFGGGTVATDESGTFSPSIPRAKIKLGGNSLDTGGNRQAWFKKFAFYPKRLSNATLQAMTEA